MTNAEKFQKVFGIYATEMWSMHEQDFLKWLNADVIERKRGEWIRWEALNGINKGSECSECGYHTSKAPNYGTNFCPNCGARMKEIEPTPPQDWRSAQTDE